MKKIGIYKITNKITNKNYIGKSKDIEKRIKTHINSVSKRKTTLYSAIQSYGWENFEWNIIELCSENELNDKEIYWINYYNSMSPNGYNMKNGGDGGITSEISLKIWERRRENGTDIMSEEQKEKIKSNSRVWTDEEKIKKSEEMSGEKNPFYGKKHSEETKRKLSESHKNKIPWNKGKKIKEVHTCTLNNESN